MSTELTNANAIETSNVNLDANKGNSKGTMLAIKKAAKKSATNIPKKNIITKESKQGEKLIAKLNLSAFSKQLQDFKGTEKIKKDTIYIYPESMNELQKSGEDGKKFRNGLRNAIIRFANNVTVYAKMNRSNDLITEVKRFEVFYKANYRLNDFSPASISQSKNDAKQKYIALFLSIAKEVVTQTSKKK